MLKFGMVLFFSVTCFAALTDLERSYWETKRSVIEENIQFSEEPRYIPKQVILTHDGEILIAPIPNPWKRVFRPGDRRADDRGMILFPNIDKEALRVQLDQAVNILKQDQ